MNRPVVFFKRENKQDDPNKLLTITSLKNAVQSNNIEQIRNSLAKYGWPKNAKITTDYSILQLAINIKSMEIAKLLINAGCRVNVKDSEYNGEYTPLALAIRAENEEIATLLIQKGASLKARNGNGLTVIHEAAKQRSLKMLKFLFQYRLDINHLASTGTPFQIYLENYRGVDQNKNTEIVRFFLAKGASINFKTSQGDTVLHHVVLFQSNDIIKHVLQLTNDVNEQNKSKNTPLHYLLNTYISTTVDMVDVVRQFILKGAKVDIQNNDGDTVCHVATKKQYVEVLQIFLRCERNVNCSDQDAIQNCNKKGANVDPQDGNLRTPLYWAVLLRNKQMVKILLDHGADPNLKDSQGETILENLMKHEWSATPCLTVSYRYGLIKSSQKIQISPDIQRDSEIAQILLSKKAVAENVSEGQVSIFHYCAINSHLNMLSKIISYSKDHSIRDSRGDTILHALLTHNLNTNAEVEMKVTEIMEKLLSKGANVTDVNEQGETLLHLAAKAKHLAATKLLLQQSVNIADLDKDGNSVLHFLCMLQSKTHESVEQNLTELFVNKGCDVNAKNNKHMTPFMSAAQSGSINMIRILRKFNAKINCHESLNLSMPIHLAAENNYQEVIEQLIQYGVDVNVRQKDRKTALHLAVAHNFPRVTRLLLEAGADTYMKDSESKTPLHWACWHESLENISELLEYGADLNVEDNFNVTPVMLTRKPSAVWAKLRYHVIKLRAANMPLSRRNESYLKKFDKENIDYSTAAEKQFETAAIEESLKMETISIGPRLSLADVLLMSADKLSILKNNENFQKLLYSANFKENYPIYADLVRACYRKGIIRSDLMLSAKNAFRKIIGLAIPDICCDIIFHYLDNENLHNLDKASKIKITKRKRFLNEIQEDIPAKRIRRISV